MAAAWFGFLAVLLFCVEHTIAQQDPLQNFCRRFSHQTCVIDNRLYIDGGLINFNPLESNPNNYSNNGLLYADFNVDNDGMPNEYKNLTKPANAPSVSGGILWPDEVNKYFYLYGGEFQTAPLSYATWQYDVVNDNWTTMAPDPSQSTIQRAAWGAGVAVQDRAIGYYYGGWLSNTTIPVWGSTPFAQSSLLMYNMVKNTWTNSTGPDTTGRAEGVMLYIPASDGGMLLYFGGIQAYTNGTWIGQPMDTIFLYDIANAKWYTQKATGNVPDMRRRFCAGVTWSSDQSSYNVYLYGGASMPPLTVGFDDVYILSMPSFQWLKWYPDQNGTSFPHHSLSCNVVNNNQMLVMGGTFPNSTICDVPSIYGFHNLDLAKNNVNKAKWGSFNYSKKGYDVPEEIIDVIGGSGIGAATKATPAGGFDNPDLGIYFTRKYTTTSSRTATRVIPTSTGKSNSHSGASNGAVIGGAVGGGIAVIIIVIAAVCFFLRRKKQRNTEPAPVEADSKEPMRPILNDNSHSYQGSISAASGPYSELHAESYQHAPVELAAGRFSVKPGYLHSPGEKYSDISTPPIRSPNSFFQEYTPTSASQTPAPMYQGYSSHQNQEQTYPSLPLSTSPPQQTYYPPPGEPVGYQQQYSPGSQHHYPTPRSGSSQPARSPAHSPGVYAPSPEYPNGQSRR